MFGWAAGRSPAHRESFVTTRLPIFLKPHPKETDQIFFTSAGGTLPGLNREAGGWSDSFRRSSTLLSISEAEIITLNSL